VPVVLADEPLDQLAASFGCALTMPPKALAGDGADEPVEPVRTFIISAWVVRVQAGQQPRVGRLGRP
jgi:hypothetical protein